MGHEVDCIVEYGGNTTAIEIKSGQTFNTDYLKGLKYLAALDKNNSMNALLIMGVAQKLNAGSTKIVGWDWLQKQKW